MFQRLVEFWRLGPSTALHATNISQIIYQTVNLSNALCDAVRDFKVSVRRTDASDRCRLKGDCVLRADMDALHLMDKTGDILYTWPYRYLRRFGRDKVTHTTITRV